MKSAIIIFPGSNRDRDVSQSIYKITKSKPIKIWHKEYTIPDNVDLIILPGGFSYGDYLRPGVLAAHSNIIKDLIKKSQQGKSIIGLCNGFQILTEINLLPGTLLYNKNMKFICKEVLLKVENNKTRFSNKFSKNQIWNCPVAHQTGNYFLNKKLLKLIEENNQIIFRYADNNNPNGSINNIAGIINKTGNVLGMMPHPENINLKKNKQYLFESVYFFFKNLSLNF